VDVFLQTARLRLRRFTTADADYLVALDGDPEVMRYLTNGKPTPREVVESEVLPSILRCYERSEAGRWAAEDLASGEFLGWLSLQPPKDGSTAELDLGYRLRRSAWGRGYAAEGARALIRKAFTDLGTQRVFAQAMAVNTRSRRVMESAGLGYLRTFHLQWDDPIPGTEHGEVEYELLREDWLREAVPMSDPRLVGSAWREEAFAVAFAEQEREAGEVVAQRLNAVGVAAHEAGEELVDRAAVGREPVVQELQELAELHRIVRAGFTTAAWRMAVVTSSRLWWSTASQSIHAIGVPSLMQAAVSTWRRRSSGAGRCRG
jgi:RimJ/RimL family protein N-acetyltransferase